ncbi:MAG: hypothetical protein ACRD4I_01930, partial [Candidatus Angelobacter sp.]
LCSLPMSINGKKRVIGVIALALVTACNKPHPSAPAQNEAPPPFAGQAPAPTGTVDLTAAVVRILETAHRSGSLIYRGDCGPERTIQERYSLRAPVKLEPMTDAFQEIAQRYPEFRVSDSRDSGVRLLDSSTGAGLLRVRIGEFTVVEDRGPEAALAVLWRMPEVIRYMANHGVRFARQRQVISPRRRRAVVVIHMKNATVEQVVERIVASYPAAQGVGGPHRVWEYRECHSGAEMLMEVKIL